MARLYLKRTLNGFAASDEASAEAMRKYKVGDTFRADVVKPRDLTNHRRYWALVTICFQNSDQFASAEQCHQYLKLRAGHCTPIASKLTGEVFYVPESISFSEMDEIGFQTFWQQVVNVVLTEVIPGIDQNSLIHEIEKICGVAA
jgi:hypothetical protein